MILPNALGDTPGDSQKKKRVCRNCEFATEGRSVRGNSMDSSTSSNSWFTYTPRPTSGSTDSQNGHSYRKSSSDSSPTHSQHFTLPPSNFTARSQTPDLISSSPPSTITLASTNTNSTNSSPNSMDNSDSDGSGRGSGKRQDKSQVNSRRKSDSSPTISDCRILNFHSSYTLPLPSKPPAPTLAPFVKCKECKFCKPQTE